jgi:hypothetical protein
MTSTHPEEAEVTIHVTQAIIDRARREGLSGAQMLCLAIQESVRDATDIEVNGQNLWSPGQATRRESTP